MTVAPLLLFAAGCGSDLVRPAARPYAASALHAYGDSITCGQTLQDAVCPLGDPKTTPSPEAYPEVVAWERGIPAANYAISGDGGCDLWPHQIAPAGDPLAPASRTVYTVQIGTNDADRHGSGPYEDTFNLCDQAAMAWLALPPQAKTMAKDAGVATTGTTNYLPDEAGQSGLLTTDAAGSTIAVSVDRASAGPVYLFYLLEDDNAGTWTWAIGGLSGSGTTASAEPILTRTGTTASMALLRIANVPPGPQVLRITQSSNGSRGFGLWAVGVPPAVSDPSLPPVIVGDLPLVRGNSGLQQYVRAYNADVSANLLLLQRDGLDLRLSDSHQLMKASSAEMSDQVHPNALGQQKLAEAFALEF